MQYHPPIKLDADKIDPLTKEFAKAFALRPEESEAEREAKRALRMAEAFANDMALRSIADEACPPDVQEFANRHKIPTFAQVVWKDAFMAGWRAALKAKHLSENQS